MTDPPDTLRPEVREAIRDLAIAARLRPEYQQPVGIIRTELRRLAGERDELRTAYTSASQSRDYWKECAGRASECATLKAQSIHPRAQLLIMLGHANDRAEKAECDCNDLRKRLNDAISERNTIRRERAQEHRKRARERAELAALKARMFQGIVLDVDDLARGHAGLPSEWRGQRVRLVVEE